MRKLLIVAVAIAVPAAAQAAVTLSGTTAFGNVQVGSTGTEALALNETGISGDNYDTVNLTYSCSDFTVTPTTGYPERDCESTCLVVGQTVCPGPAPLACTSYPFDFTATFHPSVAASESCVVTMTSYHDGSTTPTTSTFTLTGTGTAPPAPHIAVSPGSYNFGQVRSGTTSSAVTFTLTNSGSVSGSVTVGSPTNGAFAIGGTRPTSLAAGASGSFTVTCTPPGVASYSGTIAITSTPNSSISLSCAGVSSNVQVSPSPVAIAATRQGQPTTQTITLQNAGGASATINSVTVTDSADITMTSGPPANYALAAGASTNVVVSYDATAVGSAAATLHVVSDSGTLDVPITATALATSMSVTPDGSVDFGAVCSGLTSAQMFSVVANAAGPFQVTSISAPGAPFTVTPPTLPAAVQGNAGNTVSFMVTASPSIAGSAAASVEITTDIPNGTPDTIALSVTGLPAGVSATPPTVDLGAAPVFTTSFGQAVSLTNCNTGPVMITSTEITGSDATAFSVVQNPTSLQVAATDSAQWLIVMSSETSGEVDAAFEIDYVDGSGNIGSASVALTGEPYDLGSGSGAGPGGGGGGDDGGSLNGGAKSSYYACSSGGAAGAWPIALAIAALFRRRRRPSV